MTIGERIKQARKANSLSLRDLAELVGVSATAISKYERDMDIPGSGVLLRLAQSLNVKIDFFFRQAHQSFQLESFRKHASLGIKDQDSIQMCIQDWLERYLEVESFFPGEEMGSSLPGYQVRTMEDVESAALQLRALWNLGDDAIVNLVQLLEDHRIKVGSVSGYVHFDACTFQLDQNPIIVSKTEISGDRQRFNLCHELGHIVLDVQGDMDTERAVNRFAGAFLVPAETARFELGDHRSDLNPNELILLKQKYGLSMQAWVYRARDLKIISELTAKHLFQKFRMSGWHKQEPGRPYPSETSLRMEQLIYRALSEDLISRSRGQELLGRPIQYRWEGDFVQQDVSSKSSGN